MPTARELLERMRRSKAGWKERDLERLYTGFGFDLIEGRKHRMYIHPKYPDLRATVTRSSGGIPVGYIGTAVRLIDALQERDQAT